MPRRKTKTELSQRITDLESQLTREEEGALDALNRVSCQFFACPGPEKPEEDMATCCVCRVIRALQRKRDGKPPEYELNGL